jgi:hypothetical protein
MGGILPSVLPALARETVSGTSVRLGSDSSTSLKLSELTTCLCLSLFLLTSRNRVLVELD